MKRAWMRWMTVLSLLAALAAAPAIWAQAEKPAASSKETEWKPEDFWQGVSNLQQHTRVFCFY